MSTVTLSPDDIRRYDSASAFGTVAFLLSFVLHVTILLLVTWLKKASFEEPLRIVPIEVSRLIIEKPRSEEKPQEAPIIPPAKEEPLPNIIPKEKILHPQKKEAQKPRPLPPEPPKQKASENQGDSKGDANPSVIPSVEAQPIEQIKPKIPEELKTREYKSYVRVKVEIRTDGTSEATLKTSSGNEEIDRRVLDVLHQWKWRPALVDGRPVNSVRYFKFEFEVK